jgi:hypothetical protein
MALWREIATAKKHRSSAPRMIAPADLAIAFMMPSNENKISDAYRRRALIGGELV